MGPQTFPGASERDLIFCYLLTILNHYRRPFLDLDKIIAVLKAEQDRLSIAINALLDGSGLTGPSKSPASKSTEPKRGGGMTPAGRKRQAAAMKEYWAARRAKSSAIVKKVSAVAKPASDKRSGGMTPAGRKRLSEMMKKRWAERRKASKG